MKLKQLLLVTGISLGMSASLEAQIINATQPEINVIAAQNNTGLAIAPNFTVQAAAVADGAGSMNLLWIDEATGLVIDSDAGAGFDPDVAYHTTHNDLVLAYDNGGTVFINDYYFVTGSAVIDYALNSVNPIAPGHHANVDINSVGDGILCWEDAGQIWTRTFTMGPLTFGPPVSLGTGSMPDIIALDDAFTAAVTYVNPAGILHVETFVYNDLAVGLMTSLGIWNFASATTYSSPRIAGQRNISGGPTNDFALVAQTWTGTTSEVHAFFAPGAGFVGGPVVVNSAFLPCVSVNPYPVIAYNRNSINIAWSQTYLGGCSGVTQMPANYRDDVLMKSYDLFGVAFSPWVEEVNKNQSNYGGNSRTALATEYDGAYSITAGNWSEGILFQENATMFWKDRNSVVANYIEEQTIVSEQQGNKFSLANSPVDQTIEVISEDDAPATFTLMDNAGRTVELKTISNNGNNYSIDISHLSGGMYFLHCSSAASDEVLRVLQVRK